MTDPFGKTRTVRFRPRGPGRFTVGLAVPDPGLYTLRVVASGELDGQPFTREHIVSIPTVSGEPSEGATDLTDSRAGRVRRNAAPRSGSRRF